LVPQLWVHVQQQQHSLFSQICWGRLEMKPKRNKGHGLGILIASLQTLLSKATSLEIFQFLRSLLTDSLFQVSLGLTLPLFTLSTRSRPHYTRRLRRPPLDMSKPSQPVLGKFLLNWCHPYPFPNNFVPDSIPSCVPAKPLQHPHLCYTQLLDMSLFCGPTFSTI